MSEPDSANQTMERIMSLPTGKLVKGDAAYAAIYANRIDRLERMKCSDLLSARVDAAIRLTQECNEVGANLGAACMKVATNSDSAAKIRYLEWLLGHDTPQFQRVYTILRWSYDPKYPKRRERSFEENWEECFGAKLTDIGQRNSLVISIERYKGLSDQVEVFQNLSALATIYNAILYGGILNVAGSALERKERGAVVVNLIGIITGIVFPVLGTVSSLADALADAKRFFDTSEPLEAVKAVAQVENYLSTYSALLTAWKAAGMQLQDTLAKFPLGS